MEPLQQQMTKRRPMAEINVVPYIDVMLVLLIIFMVTAPMLVQSVPVNLPDVYSTPTEIDPDVGAISPKIMFARVLFPAPLVPIIPMLSPFFIVKEISFSARLFTFGYE